MSNFGAKLGSNLSRWLTDRSERQPGINGRVSLWRVGLVGLTLGLSLSVGGCGQPSRAGRGSSADGTASAAIVPSKVQRIVVLSPLAADIVHALAPDKLVAVAGDRATQGNTNLKTYETIGDHRRLDVEAIKAQKPDLVIGVAGMQARTLTQVREAGIATLDYDLETWDHLGTVIQEIAAAIDADPRPLLEHYGFAVDQASSSATDREAYQDTNQDTNQDTKKSSQDTAEQASNNGTDQTQKTADDQANFEASDISEAVNQKSATVVKKAAGLSGSEVAKDSEISGDLGDSAKPETVEISTDSEPEAEDTANSGDINNSEVTDSPNVESSETEAKNSNSSDRTDQSNSSPKNLAEDSTKDSTKNLTKDSTEKSTDRSSKSAIEKNSGLKILILASPDPLFSLNQNSWGGSLIQKVGLNPVADRQEDQAAAGYITLDPSEISDTNPDVILIVNTPGSDDPLARFQALPFWDDLEAVKADRVFLFDYYGLIQPASLANIDRTLELLTLITDDASLKASDTTWRKQTSAPVDLPSDTSSKSSPDRADDPAREAQSDEAEPSETESSETESGETKSSETKSGENTANDQPENGKIEASESAN